MSNSDGLALFVIGILFAAAILFLSIWMLAWVARDASSRGMDGIAVWIILVLLTNLLGLIIYLICRRPGDLDYCRNCRNQKLTYAKRCPHCAEMRP